MNSIVGKCSNCTIEDKNYGKYGYFMSMSNCKKKTTTESVCDIYINVFNKRHECLGSTSIFSCLYENPTRILNDGRDITKEITRDPEGFIRDGRAIQSGEVSIILLQKLAKPCGDGLGDIYNNKLEPGCLPYSSTIYSKDSNASVCYDGDSTGLSTCCNNDIKCSSAIDCNPCVSVIKNVPIEEEVWKDDICYFYCPSYWQQRQQFQATDTEGGFITDDSQLCSDTYKTLCDLAGCDPDPACKIKWGGCEYKKIDDDICNGGDWSSPFLPGYTPIKRCDLGSDYCKNKGLCVTGKYSKQCINDPIDTPPVLPTVVRRKK
jgi:hypothetical protein